MSKIHKRIRFVNDDPLVPIIRLQTDGPLVPMERLVPIENDVIPMVVLLNVHLIKGT